MIDVLTRNISRSFSDIRESFLSFDGTYKTPSNQERNNLEKDIASFQTLGRIAILASAGGGILSYLAHSVPVLGTLLGTAALVATLALAIFGYDLVIAAFNLETLIVTGRQKIQTICFRTQALDIKKTEIEKIIVKSAIEKTLFLSSLFYFLLATEQN